MRIKNRILFSGILFLFLGLPSSIFAAKTATLGLEYENSGYKKHKILYFYDGMSASRSGLKTGDLIIEFNGKSLTEQELFSEVQKNIGEKVVLTVMRGDQKLSFDVEVDKLPLHYDIYPEKAVIAELLNKDKKAFLMVLTGKINVLDNENVFKRNIEEWKETIRAQLQTQEESVMMGLFNEDPNFSIVDRNEIKKLLEEIRFAQSGYVNRDTRVQIGNLTGATLLLIPEFTRRIYSKGGRWLMDDTISSRLIDIASGKVLASKTISQTLDADSGESLKGGYHRVQ